MRDQHTVKVRVSLTFEELDENGTTVRESTNKFGVSHTMTVNNEVKARYPNAEATWAANKVGHSIADALSEALPPFLDGKTGQAFCPSTIHKGVRVPAPFGGVFINYTRPGVEPRVWYCEECATMGKLTGMFRPDKDATHGD
ncbi:hypothetical protein ArV1_073 [Arthrobacter phage vB_ArtM-ArV1]|uniref:Uncharacterized protein n=1 Tax=Arthrobacter phage vB_ArtM-ArV1 TaxID=1566993 RepID=A0A0A7HE84_9CAUD|nr:hypothetical protein ArV1_073 [Arthrobacter phage vB_ArtM-ArV1]AIZ01760.1 hypothetical protein ArV1_073 [Arthrobacter phage vB_ArtM-ArV1]